MSFSLRVEYIEEPELEFGAGCHIDIRFGLMNYGPHDVDSALARKQIRVGLVGTPDTIELASRWLERCREPIAAKPSRQPLLFPSFPGFRSDTAFHATLILDQVLERSIAKRDFEELKRQGNAEMTIRGGVELFRTEVEYLVRTVGVDVVVCAVPPEIAELRDPANRKVAPGDASPPDFHGLLKARCMEFGVPVQLMLPSTADPMLARKMKIRDETRSIQDDATRAWNFHTALYYKAHGRPWRLPRDPSQLQTCFVGVSFYKSLDGTLMTSMAQVFDERGDGVVVRGGPIELSKDDRIPHLSEEDAGALLAEALRQYRATHRTLPARVVVHKTSTFNAAERTGFRAALVLERIDTGDLIVLGQRSHVRLFRYGQYPPLRGTLLTLDSREQTLYTRGSIPFYATYPGMYVPDPLWIRCHDIESTPRQVAAEILGLTKMNWNDTQSDGGEPITVLAARRVGKILKYAAAGQPIADRYSFYM